jgi:allantoate deiminase
VDAVVHGGHETIEVARGDAAQVGERRCIGALVDLPAVRAQRVLQRADELAAFTEEPGRITRPLGTPSLDAAMERVGAWMEEAGLSVRRDALGNLVGRVGAGPGTLLLGSHLDSVADAGRYDGVLGVLVALECVQPLPLALEVAAFADEEGMRFKSAYLGSRAYLGRLDEHDLALRDDGGVALGDAIGAPDGKLAPDDLRAYFEVHIEQGPVLEAAGEPLGVVTAIAGQSRFDLAFEGVAGHAGTTPMQLRHDALAAAAEFVLAAERIALDEPGLVATVGRIGVPHGAVNVIPGRVEATLDVRHADDAVRERALAGLRMIGEALRRRRGVRVRWSTIAEHDATPLTLAPALAQVLPAAPRLPSGAGHDAVTLQAVTDAAMLFVRCAGGVSHHPGEAVTEPDVAAAIDAAREFVRLVAEKACTT